MRFFNSDRLLGRMPMMFVTSVVLLHNHSLHHHTHILAALISGRAYVYIHTAHTLAHLNIKSPRHSPLHSHIESHSRTLSPRSFTHSTFTLIYHYVTATDKYYLSHCFFCCCALTLALALAQNAVHASAPSPAPSHSPTIPHNLSVAAAAFCLSLPSFLYSITIRSVAHSFTRSFIADDARVHRYSHSLHTL